MPFPAPSGRHARAVAEPSCRPDWGSEQGTGRLGTSWGLRLQATNFRRYAAITLAPKKFHDEPDRASEGKMLSEPSLATSG